MTERWTDDAKPKTRAGIGEQVIDGEAVLVNARGGEILVLNETGSMVWSLLDGERSVAEVLRRVQDAFDVEPEVLRQDVHAFLSALREHDALEP